MITVPSGTIYDYDQVQLVRLMAYFDFIKQSEALFKLKSGVESRVYIHGREDLTDNLGLEREIGREIKRVVWRHTQEVGETRRPCLIGIPTAGTAAAQAAAMVSDPGGYPESVNQWHIVHRIMRETKKAHGDGSHQKTWVNGRPDPDRHCYMAVDNVVTDAGTKIEYADKLTEDGYDGRGMPWIILVDRQQGAMKRLKREGFHRVIVMFNLLDIVWVLGNEGIWPKEIVSAVEKEIADHQLIT